MQKLIEVVRGPLVENIHIGSIMVVNSAGNTIAKAGDDFETYMRSSAKPLQLIPLIETHCSDKFGFTNQELAIMAGSHYGTFEHAETIAGILKKLDLPIDALQCGVHEPFSRPYAQELRAQGKTPNELNNNCSGKHSAMLALCKYFDWDLASYLSPSHPVQRLMLRTISEMAELDENNISIGVDGCGVPVFGFALSAMAVAFAKLGSPNKLPSERKLACEKVSSVMKGNPIMVAGEGALDTVLLSLPQAHVISKIGAEAVFCFALPKKSWGVAVKIADGNPKMLGPVVIETLNQLGILNTEELDSLNKYHKLALTNFAKTIVGEVRPAFSLELF